MYPPVVLPCTCGRPRVYLGRSFAGAGAATWLIQKLTPGRPVAGAGKRDAAGDLTPEREEQPTDDPLRERAGTDPGKAGPVTSLAAIGLVNAPWRDTCAGNCTLRAAAGRRHATNSRRMLHAPIDLPCTSRTPAMLFSPSFRAPGHGRRPAGGRRAAVGHAPDTAARGRRGACCRPGRVPARARSVRRRWAWPARCRGCRRRAGRGRRGRAGSCGACRRPARRPRGSPACPGRWPPRRRTG